MSVHVLPQAQHDVQEAVKWYDSQRFGLGAEFLDEFHTALEDIEPDPLRFPVLELPLSTARVIRRRPMSRFPHLVIFEVTENGTLVVAVPHPSREPTSWLGRIE